MRKLLLLSEWVYGHLLGLSGLGSDDEHVRLVVFEEGVVRLNFDPLLESLSVAVHEVKEPKLAHREDSGSHLIQGLHALLFEVHPQGKWSAEVNDLLSFQDVAEAFAPLVWVVRANNL